TDSAQLLRILAANERLLTLRGLAQRGIFNRNETAPVLANCLFGVARRFVAGVNYFFRRIASPDRLPIGGRCLTVIVTGSNNLGGSDGEETQWIGTSGTDCGGSRSVFDQRAVCEAGDSARVFGDHWLPPKVGDPNLERQWWRQRSGRSTSAASTLR